VKRAKKMKRTGTWPPYTLAGKPVKMPRLENYKSYQAWSKAWEKAYKKYDASMRKAGR
jgi:hypothetical protein